jgi:radical SAM-linked protein
MIRFRITYSKTNPMRYTGNLDVHKVWERTFRRAGLPLAYSQGFHPQPRLNQACPLPLGMISKCEVVDVWIEDDLVSKELVTEKLVQSVPDGLEIQEVMDVPLNAPALQCLVLSAEYNIHFSEMITDAEIKSKLEGILNSNSLVRERRGKTYDLRPLIQEARVISENNTSPTLILLLAAGQNASGRPDEVLSVLGIDPFSTLIERTALLFAS